MGIEAMRIVKLTESHVLKPFDCGDQDLNDFLFNDAKNYYKHRLSVTYLLENETETVAYFSVSNDKLSINESDKPTWRKIKHLFNHRKHRGDYPAVKVGRLAVNLKYQGHDIGSDLLSYIKCMFAEGNRTGCAFITVDALNNAVQFYSKNKFRHLRREALAQDSETFQLYFDLAQLD